VVFANHELTASGVTSSNGGAPFLFSRVSRLRIDPFTLHITGGDYVEDGSGGYIRLCSATWVGAFEGFPTGYFLTARGCRLRGWASPDNVGISRKSIMVMEDPAYSGYDGSRAPGIWNAPLRSDGRRVGAFREVVKVTQEELIPGDAGKCVDAAGLCWESSGIISTDKLLGPGTWLFDVQAHTLPFTVGTGADAKNYSKESGQLLFLRLPGS